MKKLSAFIILLFPIITELELIKSLPTTVIYILISCILVFFNIVKNKGFHIKLNKRYLAFIIILIISNCVIALGSEKYLSITDIIKSIINQISFFIIIFSAYTYTDLNYVKKIYMTICNVLSLQIIIQYIFFYIFNIRIAVNIFGIELFTDNLYKFYRPSGIFTEPSHFANYFSLVIFLELIINKNMKKAIFYTLINLMTTSNNGILLSVIIWGGNILTRFKLKDIVITAITIIIILNTNTPLINNVKERFISGGSYTARVSRGIEIYKNLEFKDKILGIGLQNVSNYTSYNQLVTEYDEENGMFSEFMSTIIYIFISSGVLSGLSFVYLLFSKGIKENTSVKILSAIIFSLAFTSNIFTSYIWCFYFYFYFKYSKNNFIKINFNRRYLG